MRDRLKDFIENNREGFKETPSGDVWNKIDTALKQENIYKSKNISAMLKYGFGASVIIAGTFIVMDLQKEKTGSAQIINEAVMDTKHEYVNTATYTSALTFIPLKKVKKEPIIQSYPGSVFEAFADTVKEVINRVEDTTVLYASHKYIKDSLDITNWPSAGSQRKKYTVSAYLLKSGETVACIKSLSKKTNGFITMMQSNVPDKYLGKRVRMTGYLRTENVAEWAGLWMRVGVKGGDEALAFDNMRYGKKDRSVKGTTERTKYEIVLDVPPNSANIIYGVMLVGTGTIYFDSFILEIVDDSVPTTGGDPDKLGLYKTDKNKSYNLRNFWRWYVTGRKISKDGTSNIDLEPNNF